MRLGTDLSPVNTFTQTIEMADEFLADDEWMVRATQALALANFTGLTNLRHHTARLNADETVTISLTAFSAQNSAIRGVRSLQKLLQTVIGNYCLYFTASPSLKTTCSGGTAAVSTDLVVEPPAANGSTTVSNPCTCAP